MSAHGPETNASSLAPSEDKLSIADRAKLGAAAIAFGLEFTPANEATRAFVGFQLLEHTHNPLIVGAGIGLATIAIEGSAGLATAAAIHVPSEKIRRIRDKTRSRIEKKDPDTQKPTVLGDSLVALGIGSPALVVKKHLQEVDRTFETDKKTVAKATGAIAIFSAGVGALAGGGIEYADKIGLGDEAEIFVNIASDWKTYAIALGAYGGYSWLKKRLEIINDKKPFETREVTSAEDIEKALALEQEVWNIKEYGSLDVYDKYIPQSRIFAAFNTENKDCIGIARLFSGQPELPPFVGAPEMKFNDSSQKEEIVQGCIDGEIEEFGTVAVHPNAPTRDVYLELCRLAYRDAYARGIKTWGIIMEPRRVKAMNWAYGFTFRQLGEPAPYQGGDCAPHVMDLEEVRNHMKSKKPERYDWFVNQPLG